MATIGQSGRVSAGRWWSVTIDLEAERLRLGDLLDGGDPAVDGEHEPAAVFGEPRDRGAGDAVALLEPARQVPLDLRAELPERQDGERGRADAVDVVVAVHADTRAGRDRGADALDRLGHVAQQERVVRLALAVEEGAGCARVGVPATDEDRRRRLAELELPRQRLHLGVGTAFDRPGAVEHGRPTVRTPSDGGGSALALGLAVASERLGDDLHPEQDDRRRARRARARRSACRAPSPRTSTSSPRCR